MPTIKAQFRGIQEELPASNSPSGICLDTLNTVIDGNSVLSGRLGFNVWNNNVTSLGKILSSFVATFSDGRVFVVTKRYTDATPDTGKLYHWQVYPTASVATGWTEIQCKWTSNIHDPTDPGWYFMAGDRMYHFDRVGGTKWDGTSASSGGSGVWKAGIEGSIGPTLTPISGGGKEGHYHVTTTNVNSKTGEESIAGGYQSGGAAETRLSAASAKGGLQITNWTGSSAGITDKTADKTFEFDWHNVYCSLGNTERIGLGSGVEQFSYDMYLEDTVKTSASATYSGIYRMDAIMATNPMLSNRGGQPPGAKYGCWNGSQAVYLEVYPKAKGSIPLDTWGANTLAKGLMMYSIPGHPASVPQVSVFDIGGVSTDRERVVPAGGSHEIPSNITGLVTGCGYVGNSFVIFTNSSTYTFRPDRGGGMRPLLADPNRGAVGYIPVVSTPTSVHALGKNTWLKIGGGIRNLAKDAFTPSLSSIPVGGIAATTGAYYSYQNQVWFAVAKAGGAKAQRILILDESSGELVSKFDPANLSTAGITSMVELSHPAQSPIMLVTLDTGVILSWPGSAYLDGSTAYACKWRGLFGQEYRQDTLRIEHIHSSMEMVPALGITLRVAGVQNAAQAAAAVGVTKTIPIATVAPTETRVDRASGATFDASAHGRMFAIEYSSTTSQGADWKVGDLILDIKRN